MFTKKEFEHVRNVLAECGYPEMKRRTDEQWYIQIEVYDCPRIYPHWFNCENEKKAYAAVTSLLNKTNVYEVTVFSPNRNPTTFRGSSIQREWNWTYHFHK